MDATTTPPPITVQFGRAGSKNFTFVPPGNIVVYEPGTREVSFKLKAGPLTRFAAVPIQFKDNAQPKSVTGFSVDATRRMLTVTVNTDEKPKEISFSLRVRIRGGTIFISPDPTIVTMLPPDGSNMNNS